MKTQAQLYKYHCANRGRIESAIKRISLNLRRAVASEDRHTIKAFLPLYGLLIGASAEASLQKILCEPTPFTIGRREHVLESSTHLERWKRLVDAAFRTHFGLNEKTPLDKNTIPLQEFAIYTELVDLLDHELRIIIEIRNKLAHGQWEYPLNEDCTDVLPEKKKLLDRENLVSLELKHSIIDNLLKIIRDLSVSHRTVVRDFPLFYRRIQNARCRLTTVSYDKYKLVLVARRKRGLKKRTDAYRTILGASPGMGFLNSLMHKSPASKE